MNPHQVSPHLSWSQQRILDDAYAHGRRKLWLAYLLDLFLGCAGIHRIYLGHKRTGLLMLALWLTGALITVTIVLVLPDPPTVAAWSTLAGLLMLSTWAWELVDLFLIPMFTRRFNAELADDLLKRIQAGSEDGSLAD